MLEGFMKKTDVLYLGSRSQGRRELLTEGAVPFKLLAHRASELESSFQGDLGQYVSAIARDKYNSLALPARHEVDSDLLFVLTADTVVQLSTTGEIFGKPTDAQDARRILMAEFDEKLLVMSGHCLVKLQWQAEAWQIVEQKVWASGAEAIFSVPEEEIDLYLERCPGALHSSGAGVIEGFGNNYFKYINGSYSAVKGIDLFQVRANLKSFGFRF